MSKMIAYCGLICTECEAYVATQANNSAALERMAVKAREEWGIPDATAASIMCDGCLSNSDRLCGFCYECQVRACAKRRSVENCAHCDDYGCDTLEAFFAMAPKARTNLESIRAGLAA